MSATTLVRRARPRGSPPSIQQRSPLDEATTLSGGRVRIPTAMLADSKNYSALAVCAFAWIEKLDDPHSPAYAGRAWYASRLKTSVPSVARALRQLCAPTPFPRVVSFQTSPYSTADRWTVRIDGDAYVQVPAWVLRLIEHGLLSHKGFRLYAGYLSLKKGKRKAVRVSNAELAEASGLGLDAVPRYRRECEAAGLLLVLDDGRGRNATVVPLLEETSEEQRESLLNEARTACGQLRRDGVAAPAQKSTASRESDLRGSGESDTPPNEETHAKRSNSKPPDQGLWITPAMYKLDSISQLQERRMLIHLRHRELDAAEREGRAPRPTEWARRIVWFGDGTGWIP